MAVSMEELRTELRDSVRVKQKLIKDECALAALKELVDKCVEALKSDGKILFCGNGGSFADAQHLSAEFTSRFMFDRESLPSLALGANSSAMSAIGNDYGFQHIFSREFSSIAQANDVLIAISTSGKSPNVLNVINAAIERGVYVALLTGDRQELVELFSDVNLIMVPSVDTARIQECHITMGHALCGLVEKNMFANVENVQ